MSRFHPREIIERKRDGLELTEEQIRDYVAGVVDGTWGDVQLGAFLMAVCTRGMTVEETGALTLAMRDSGDVLDLSSIPGVKVDKHSTGGVGDKVSLPLAPAVAACGVPVPMIAGRGLGHTGGTIDKLRAIPRFRTDLDETEFVRAIRECGYVIAGATTGIAPADRRTYAARDISGTVSSIPLITASILSKKLAEGIDALVLDVKCGRAAFLPAREDAEALLESLVSTGTAAGKKVSALLTDMDTPLGLACGNALEIHETLDCLRGGGPADLRELTIAFGAEMLRLAGVCPDLDEGAARIAGVLDDGRALDVFKKNVQAQGGRPEIVDEPSLLPTAPVVAEVVAERAGFVQDLEPKEIGLVVCDLGGGRRQPTDTIDLAVGVVLRRKRGDRVEKGDVLAEIHAREEGQVPSAIERVHATYTIGDAAPDPRPLVLMARRADL
jgi:pyrimidine-nucleoside phosphorylase